MNKTDPDGEAAFLIPVVIFIAKEVAGEVFERQTGLPAPTVKGLGKAVGKKIAKASAEAKVKRTAAGKRVGDYTRSEKTAAKRANASDNGGQMACTDCKEPLRSVKSEKGIPTPKDQAQVHHDPPIHKGGGRDSKPVVLCPPCHVKRHQNE